MPNAFVISDLHLGHNNILKFTRSDGQRLRPFNSLEEMHGTIIENWNSVVKPQDKVYVLGDVAFGSDALQIMKAMHGHKRLVRGNHDLYNIKNYLAVFEEVYGVRQIDGVWMTHVPMHEDCVNGARVKVNIHGHLHYNVIEHQKYFNASVERINYTPIHIDEVLSIVKKDMHWRH